jgi:hypothetical protein
MKGKQIFIVIVILINLIPFVLGQGQGQGYLKKVGSLETQPPTILVAGTEYTTGQSGKTFFQLSQSGYDINNATCRLSVYYPNATAKYIDNQMMINLYENGLYYYPFSAPDIEGIYMISARCNYYLEDVWIYDLVGDSDYPHREVMAGTTFGSGYNLNNIEGLYEECVAESIGGSYDCEIYYNFTTDSEAVDNMVLFYSGESDSDPTVEFFYWDWEFSAWSLLNNSLEMSASIPSQAYSPSGIGDFVTNDIPNKAFSNDTGTIRIRLHASHNKQYDLWNDWLNINHFSSQGQTVSQLRGGGEIHIYNEILNVTSTTLSNTEDIKEEIQMVAYIILFVFSSILMVYNKDFVITLFNTLMFIVLMVLFWAVTPILTYLSLGGTILGISKLYETSTE